jgi:hypothetical protein
LIPLQGMTIGTSLALSDAKLSENLPSTATVIGHDGDRLPNSSRFSGDLWIDQEFPLVGAARGVVGATVGYVGDRQSVFTGGAGARQTFPSYTKLDMHAGVNYHQWRTDLSINNLTDKRGVLYGGVGALPSFAYLYIQPLTVALSVSRKF